MVAVYNLLQYSLASNVAREKKDESLKQYQAGLKKYKSWKLWTVEKPVTRHAHAFIFDAEGRFDNGK